MLDPKQKAILDEADVRARGVGVIAPPTVPPTPDAPVKVRVTRPFYLGGRALTSRNASKGIEGEVVAVARPLADELVAVGKAEYVV